MQRKWHIPRRTFLRGLGTVIALPVLEAMAPPLKLLGATKDGKKALPRRMAFVFVPNGANMADWTPKTVGSNFELPFILEPLKAVRDDLIVFTGLAQDQGFPHGDGAGDHARAAATFLTGCHPRKTAGADIKVGISVDQVAAAQIGNQTRLPSLELGCDPGQLAGNCDSGYSCAYSYNISWKTASTPMPSERNPRLVFERLFSNGDPGETHEARERRQRYEKSILDLAADDANRLRANLGYSDRHKLDEYLTGVRELEQRIASAEKFAATVAPDIKEPNGIPPGFEQQVRLMFDLMALAFQTDATRISTFMVRHDGDNSNYPFTTTKDGHHTISHHGRDEAKIADIAKINRYHMTQFAYFLERMKNIREGEGTLLDNCMVVYGSGIGDGDRHNHDNLPIIMAGRGGGTIQTGRHIKYESETPMNNLFMSMLERMNVHAQKIGDSTGKLVELG